MLNIVKLECCIKPLSGTLERADEYLISAPYVPYILSFMFSMYAPE